MQKDSMTKYLPLVLVLIALVFSVSYFHESEITEVQDEVQSGMAAHHKSELPL